MYKRQVPVPISVKIEYAKQRIIERGNKRVERFNRTHKLQQFNVGEKVLIKANPVGKRSDNTAKNSLNCIPDRIHYNNELRDIHLYYMTM